MSKGYEHDLCDSQSERLQQENAALREEKLEIAKSSAVLIDAAKVENEALRAKVEELEKQQPLIGECLECGAGFTLSNSRAVDEFIKYHKRIESLTKTLESCRAAMDYAYEDHADQYYLNVKNLIESTLAEDKMKGNE